MKHKYLLFIHQQHGQKDKRFWHHFSEQIVVIFQTEKKITKQVQFKQHKQCSIISQQIYISYTKMHDVSASVYINGPGTDLSAAASVQLVNTVADGDGSFVIGQSKDGKLNIDGLEIKC